MIFENPNNNPESPITPINIIILGFHLSNIYPKRGERKATKISINEGASEICPFAKLNSEVKKGYQSGKVLKPNPLLAR